MSDAELYKLAADRLDKDRLKAIFIEAAKMPKCQRALTYSDSISMLFGG